MSKPTDRKPFIPSDERPIDEPRHRFGAFDPFQAQYELNGVGYEVTIQGFCKDELEHDNYRYRVVYPGGEEKILDYVLGAGFIEEGIGQSGHARSLGACIKEHFALRHDDRS